MSALSRLALAGFALAAVPALALGLKVDVNKGLWTHTRGGFYHDGRFATLPAVVEHYDAHFGLGLAAQEKADLVQYLKSL